MSGLYRVIAGLSFVLAAGFAQAAPILVVDGSGILTGARNVDVGGVLYDVDFRDGSCQALFSGCDSVADFPFQTLPDAQAAAQALLDQVFLDGAPPSLFDTHPELINGCTSLDFCDVLTPREFVNSSTVSSVGARDTNGVSGDTVGLNVNTQVGQDLTAEVRVTYAVWSLSPTDTTVPEPSTYACLLLAAALAFTVSRRRKRNPSIQQRL